jgi:glycolate oxidase iron-sulfur subunit
MQTNIAEPFRNTAEGREADRILRSCVHCGFCTATCPTYQVLGDELDGPRGRIYLVKQILEGNKAGKTTQRHLDRCLLCRSCETTCPSGVEYARLVDIGRSILESRVPRTPKQRLFRWLLRAVVPFPRRFKPLLAVSRLVRPFLPTALAAKIPKTRPVGHWPAPRQIRTMLAFDGCVQACATPDTNAATARILDRLGICLVKVPAAGCCGAVSHHLGAAEEARDFMRRNIDAWWPLVEAGAEAIVVTASGCTSMLRDYPVLLGDDPDYAEKASRLCPLIKDPAEIIHTDDLSRFGKANGECVAFHSPCSQQHALRICGDIERILSDRGYRLAPVPEGHLCCGSAGTYSLLQPALSRTLRDNKLQALQSGRPDIIATANIGCQLHLETGIQQPVVHWLELLDRL